jgi:hypothetical protein
MTKAEETVDHALLQLLGAVAMARAEKQPVAVQLKILDDALEVLKPARETFERDQSERWLEHQAKMLKPAEGAGHGGEAPAGHDGGAGSGQAVSVSRVPGSGCPMR